MDERTNCGPHPRRTLLIALVAGALAAAGCGAEESKDTVGAKASTVPAAATVAVTTTTDQPTRAEYTATLDGFCRKQNGTGRAKAINDDISSLVDADKYTAAADAVEAYTEWFRQQTDRLRAIPRPAESLDFDGYFTLLSDRADALSEFANGLRVQDAAAIDRVSERLQRLKGRGEGLAQVLGFKSCGRS